MERDKPHDSGLCLTPKGCRKLTDAWIGYVLLDIWGANEVKWFVLVRHFCRLIRSSGSLHSEGLAMETIVESYSV